ncbi:MAG: TlpA disulfide reductase family protein [Alphaproteobacteria bacterium]
MKEKAMKLLLTAIFACILWACDSTASDDIRADYLRQYIGRDINKVLVADMEGGMVTFGELLQGKPMLLNLWATWCPPCIEEFPSLNALGQQGEFDVVAMSIDHKRETVANFLGKSQLDTSGMQLLHDASARATRTSLGASQYPTTYVVSPAGKIVGIYTGLRDWTDAKLLEKVRNNLKE